MEISDLSRHVWRGMRAELGRATIPTGFAELDRHLPGGGWPRGAIIEIFVERYGVGELTLLIPALGVLTQAAAPPVKWIAWIAPPLIPYAPALEQRGVSTDRLLMIHPSASHKDRLWAVEQVLRSHPAVEDVVVVGRPDPEWGELVTAVVVGSVTLDELRDHARATLPPHAAPRAVELVPEIPLLASGKPDRVRLRRPL